MTYLQLVNDVLVRLRETEVNSVQDNLYSKLIGKLVNDSKRRVEDSFNWNALGQTVTIATVANTYSYVLTGTQGRFKVIDVINDTSDSELRNASVSWMTKQFLANSPQYGDPMYYGFNGVDTNGDAKVDLFPIPNSVQNVRFSMYLPQDDLSADADILTVPWQAVVQGAYAVALSERGEDNGLMSAEATMIYRDTLATHIAIENSRYVENDCWISV